MADNIIDLATLAPKLRRFDRLLGLDLGTKTIGIAVSDVERRLASPVMTIRRTRFTHDAAALLTQVKNLEVVALVIGLPLNMDGTEGRASRRPAPSSAACRASPPCPSFSGTSGCRRRR